MSAITADGADFPREHGRFKKLVRRTRQKAARALARTGHGIAAATLWVGRSIKKAAVGTGSGAIRAGGIAATVVIWTIRLVLQGSLAITLSAALVLLIVVGLVSGGLAYIVAKAYDVVNKYVYLPVLWVAKGRPMSFSYFKTSRLIRQEERAASTVETVKDTVKEKLVDLGLDADFLERHGATGHVDKDGVLIVGRAPLTNPEEVQDLKVRGDLASFNRNVARWVTEAEREPRIGIPGTVPLIPIEVDIDPESVLENPDDPFSNEGASFQPNFLPIMDLVRSGQAAGDFNFAPYLDEVETLIMAYEYLRDSSPLIEERSYWMGRYEMLKRWEAMKTKKRRDDFLDEHGRAFGIIHQQLKNQQDRYSLKHVFGGLKDQTEELKSLRTKTATR